MKESNNYLKVVEWSEEDKCFVGTAPGILLGGVHGKKEEVVFQQLKEAVDEAIKLMKSQDMPLPAATANRKYSGKIALRIPEELHKSLAIKSIQVGESLNKFIQHKLETVV
jgi:predicted HicB family RNase H-like nuclease